MTMNSCCKAVLIGIGFVTFNVTAQDDGGWPQWGQNPRHSGSIDVRGQSPNRKLANTTYDPFVAKEQGENNGELLAHYQAPLTSGQDVFMEFISGTYVTCNPPGSFTPFPCGNDNWFNQVWNEKRLHWEGGQLVEKWSFASDWKPEPDASGELGGWQPVFHAALTEDAVWVPGAGGTVFKLSRGSGHVIARMNPFGSTIDPNTFVSSPITVDEEGNVYYNVLKLNITNDPNTNDPWAFGPNFDGNGVVDIPDAWLVKISEDGIKKVSYKSLTFNPPAPTTCNATFGLGSLPWPPSPTATPRTVPCLSQRPGVNITPAIAPNGTIYSVTVAHNPFASRYAYVLAFDEDLNLKWTASMRDRLNDGCGVIDPIATSNTPQANACRFGANFGVDPATNEKPAGRVIDQSSSSPVVTPDGGVIYGAYTRYNYARGHMFRFDAAGNFKAAFDFGWDSTPAIYEHSGTYSVVIKDNHYDAGAFCEPDPSVPVSLTVCVDAPKGPYFITQLGPNMNVEWQFKNTSTDGTHNNGFEWCINAPAIDDIGNVYVNSEDGRLYVLQQGGAQIGNIFLNQAVGAAYTPLSLGADGKIYTENDGILFVVGH
jgi:hypothetical protein